MEQCKGSYSLFLVLVRKIHVGNLVRRGKKFIQKIYANTFSTAFSLKAQIEYHIFQSKEPNIYLRWDIQIFEAYF